MKKGDKIEFDFEGVTVEGEIELASSNEVSLMLKFDQMLWKGDTGVPGKLPVLKHEDGVYRDIIWNKPVTIRPKHVSS